MSLAGVLASDIAPREFVNYQKQSIDLRFYGIVKAKPGFGCCFLAYILSTSVRHANNCKVCRFR